jgi:hypothetical protein
MLETCAREGGSSVVEMRAASVYRREMLLKICKKADKIDGGRKETVVSKEKKRGNLPDEWASRLPIAEC